MAEENKEKKEIKALNSVEHGLEKVGKVKFISEFKAFISKGNVMDMAVGMIVGAAFTAIVTALVNNVLMPALGMITGGIDFSDLKIILKPAVIDAVTKDVLEPEVAIGYGAFIGAIINFLLIAISVFILIKILGCFKRKKKEEPKAEEPKPDPQIVLLTEIRDLLKNGGAAEAVEPAEALADEQGAAEAVTQ